MSRYSVSLRTFILSKYERQHPDYDEARDFDDIVKSGIDWLFSPFDMKYGDRDRLLSLFITRYYKREICYETIAYWKVKVHAKFLELLPKYEGLYRSVSDEFDYEPLRDFEVHEDTNRDIEGKSDISNAQASLTNFADTPDGILQDLKDRTSLYSTNVTTDDRDGKTNQTTESNDVFHLHKYGKVSAVSYAKLVQEYRDALINIDEQFINEFKSYFVNLWY